jgi:hypothetical protein
VLSFSKSALATLLELTKLKSRKDLTNEMDFFAHFLGLSLL